MTKNALRGARPRAPEPFPGNHPPSVEELDHGLDFFDCDPIADAIHWSTGLLLDFLDIPPPRQDGAGEALLVLRLSANPVGMRERVR